MTDELLQALLANASADVRRANGLTGTDSPKGRKARQKPAQLETEPIRATVDMLPPTVNHMYCAGRGGRRYLSDGARTWYEVAVFSIRSQVGTARIPHKTPLRLSIVAYGLPRTTDVDNIGKASVDAIAKALEFDDRWIDSLHIERGAWKRGQAVRTVYCLEVVL